MAACQRFFDDDIGTDHLEPNVLVKGGDYGVDEVVGADVVAAYGGEVQVLGLVEDCSTTEILEKVRG